MKTRLFLSIALAFAAAGLSAIADSPQHQQQLALQRVLSQRPSTDCPPCPECPLPERKPAEAGGGSDCPPCPVFPTGATFDRKAR